MITEMDAAALMAEANPVPDLDSYDVADDPGIAAYLATLEQRSSRMTQPDTKRKDQKEKMTVRQRWLVAAVVIILAGIALVLVDRGDETPVAVHPGLADPATVIEDYAAAYNSRDFDAVMVLFSEESVITGSPFFESAGLTAIRAVQIQDINAGATEDAYTISNVEVTGNTVTWDQVWISRAGEELCLEGQSAVIEDGKILLWTWPGPGVPCP